MHYLPGHRREERTEDGVHQFPSKRQAQPQDAPVQLSRQETPTRPWESVPRRVEFQNHWTQSPTVPHAHHCPSF